MSQYPEDNEINSLKKSTSPLSGAPDSRTVEVESYPALESSGSFIDAIKNLRLLESVEDKQCISSIEKLLRSVIQSKTSAKALDKANIRPGVYINPDDGKTVLIFPSQWLKIKPDEEVMVYALLSFAKKLNVELIPYASFPGYNHHPISVSANEEAIGFIKGYESNEHIVLREPTNSFDTGRRVARAMIIKQHFEAYGALKMIARNNFFFGNEQITQNEIRKAKKSLIYWKVRVKTWFGDTSYISEIIKIFNWVFKHTDVFCPILKAENAEIFMKELALSTLPYGTFVRDICSYTRTTHVKGARGKKKELTVVSIPKKVTMNNLFLTSELDFLNNLYSRIWKLDPWEGSLWGRELWKNCQWHAERVASTQSKHRARQDFLGILSAVSTSRLKGLRNLLGNASLRKANVSRKDLVRWLCNTDSLLFDFLEVTIRFIKFVGYDWLNQEYQANFEKSVDPPISVQYPDVVKLFRTILNKSFGENGLYSELYRLRDETEKDRLNKVLDLYYQQHGLENINTQWSHYINEYSVRFKKGVLDSVIDTTSTPSESKEGAGLSLAPSKL